MPHKKGHPPKDSIVIVRCVPRGRGNDVVEGKAYWTGRMWRGAFGFRMSSYRVVEWESLK